ncbi:YceI family protein [Olivibacter sitiensis]|uniref:YceI family protein n=1 Tax=Olivibacter sitiensis TaxID=376470 RepID=UPI00041081F4|nr:YceI family protein [Olivibacter sitiensis]
MKKKLLAVGISALLLASCAGNPEGKRSDSSEATEVATTEGKSELAVDTAASEVRWEGTKVTGSHHGTVKIKSGNLYFEDSTLVGGNFVLDLNTIANTDLDGESKQKLEGHLKSEDFFDVAKFPEATFEISKVSKEGSTLKISGNLTIRGVSKNITIDAEQIASTGEHFEATTDFNIVRGDWGVNYEGKQDDLISKEINFKIKIIAH